MIIADIASTDIVETDTRIVLRRLPVVDQRDIFQGYSSDGSRVLTAGPQTISVWEVDSGSKIDPRGH